MARILIVLGAPGSGKGQQSALLHEAGWTIVSSGQLLRACSDSGTALGEEIRTYLAAGALVPDNIMITMIQQHIAGLDVDNIILDGFPRTLSQAQAMTAYGVIPSHITVNVIADTILLERIAGRWFDPHSGRVYHSLYSPPKVVGYDDINHNVLVRREDDKPDIVRSRLGIYHASLKNILGYYHHLQQTHALTVCYINAEDSIDGVYQAVLSAVS